MKNYLAAALLSGASVFSLSANAGGDIAAGKAVAAKYNCAACHGQDYNSPIDPSYPKLAGQYAEYLEHAMIAYQRGGDHINGRSNAIMAAQAKPLSKKEIQDISAYLSSLPGSLVVRR
jgi:cytochrome c553